MDRVSTRQTVVQVETILRMLFFRGHQRSNQKIMNELQYALRLGRQI